MTTPRLLPAAEATTGDGRALRLVVDRGTNLAPSDEPTAPAHAGPIVPLHPSHRAPAADALVAIERHGLRVTVYADATLTVATPHVADAPCEPLVDAHLEDAGTAPGAHDHDTNDHGACDRATSRFVVRYEAPDDRGRVARVVDALRRRTRSARPIGHHELHLVTEQRVHVIDLPSWGIDPALADQFVRDVGHALDQTRDEHCAAAHGQSPSEGTDAGSVCELVARRLRDLDRLHADGLVTDEQYAITRTRIIDSI